MLQYKEKYSVYDMLENWRDLEVSIHTAVGIHYNELTVTKTEQK